MNVAFFTDRDLGKMFPTILRDAELRVECHADHFRPDATDEEWLAETAQRSWVAVAHDRRNCEGVSDIIFEGVGLVATGCRPRAALVFGPEVLTINSSGESG